MSSRGVRGWWAMRRMRALQRRLRRLMTACDPQGYAAQEVRDGVPPGFYRYGIF